MAGSTFGNIFSVTTWGESHGPGIGAVIDGCPSGLLLCEQDIQVFLNRRKPGQSKYTTPRNESDTVEILSGVFNGRTTGTPISLFVRNLDQHSGDYGNISSLYRPGHADYTYEKKYGLRDYRGGGRASGRETIGRVAAGAIACKLLTLLGVTFHTYTKSIGPIRIPASKYDYTAIAENPLYMPNAMYAQKAQDYLDLCMKNQDSTGGIVECRISGVPAGIGTPVFEKLDANLAKAILSIGAVKGFEIGTGFASAKAFGSTNNDCFVMEDQHIAKKSNHAGGILGGISDGSEIVFRAAIKPTPSISMEQQTVSTEKENQTISITGRHDPVIVPRAVVVVESMAALTLLDSLLLNMTTQTDQLLQFYK